MIALVHDVPEQPICRSAAQPGEPCFFARTCHAERQDFQHQHHLRGVDCWAFVLMSAPPLPVKGAA